MTQYSGKSYLGLSFYYHITVFFRRIELALFLLLSLILIITTKIDNKLTYKISEFFIDVSVPIVKAGTQPFTIAVDTITNFEELAAARRQNKILTDENDQLKSLYIQAIDIKRENEELKKLLKFVEINSAKYKSANLIANSINIYNNNVFINSGSNQGIMEDSVVIGNSTMIGRVSYVGVDKSQIMLVTDMNSRVPIITSQTGNRGILAGNNGELMEITYIKDDHNIKMGEFVFTSGDDEYLPSSLLVGVVVKSKPDLVLVKMAADVAKINVVSVIEY